METGRAALPSTKEKWRYRLNFIFRVDSSSVIGHGHLMRCLVLAHELNACGAIVQFICRVANGSAHKLIEDSGYKLHLLTRKTVEKKAESYESWLGTTQEKDAKECNKILENILECTVIVDHYGLDISWESMIESKNIIVIDDLANRKHKCSVLIDQSLINDKSSYDDLIDNSYAFIGNENVILRQEFRTSSSWKLNNTGSLLICMGGSDPDGITIKIVDVLNKISIENHLIKRVQVIVGKGFSLTQLLEEKIANYTSEIKINKAPDCISELMLESSLCILSGGTMILEACSLGVPSIGVVIAENQKETALYLSERKAIKYLPIDGNLEKNLNILITRVLDDERTALLLSEKSKKMVNKYSVTRIAKELINDQ